MFKEAAIAALLAVTPAAAPAELPAPGLPLVSGVVTSKFYEPATRPGGIVGWLTDPECWGLEIDQPDVLVNRPICTDPMVWSAATVGVPATAPEYRHAWWIHFR